MKNKTLLILISTGVVTNTWASNDDSLTTDQYLGGVNLQQLSRDSGLEIEEVRKLNVGSLQELRTFIDKSNEEQRKKSALKNLIELAEQIGIPAQDVRAMSEKQQATLRAALNEK